MISTASPSRRDDSALSLGPALSRIRHSISVVSSTNPPLEAEPSRPSEPNIFNSWSHSLNRLEQNLSRVMNRHSVASRHIPRSRNDTPRPSSLEDPLSMNSSSLLRCASTSHSRSHLPRRSEALAAPGSSRSNTVAHRPLSTVISSGRDRSSLSVATSSERRLSHDLISRQARSSLANLPSPPGDELPSYSRRAPLVRPFSYAGTSLEPDPQSSRRASHIPSSRNSADSPDSRLKPHIITSTSGKIQLTLFSPGHSRYPVLVQEIDQELRGELRLNLGDVPESFSEIRIKCKGVARTLVVRNHANGSNLINDEIVFMRHDQSVYQPSILASGDSKLSGTVKFPFKFPIASNRHISGPLPPTFSLTSSLRDSSGANFGLESSQKVTEWASVKYYVKVTLARRGLLRSNERLFAPFVLLSKQTQPPVRSLTQLAAMNLGLPIPNPSEDPDSWMGRKIRQHVKVHGHGPGRGLKTAWFEVMVLLPSPLCFARNQPLPYYLKFISSNPALTTEFNDSTFKVSLLQRASLTAVGVTGTHENVLSKGYSMPEGPNNGITLPSLSNESWSRRYQGELPLGNNFVPNFACPNISVQYYFNVSVCVPGQTNDLQISLPIQLVSSPGRSQSSLGHLLEDPSQFPPPPPIDYVPERQFNSVPTPRPGRPRIPNPNLSVGEMPPSYRDVQEMDGRRRPGLV